MRKPLGKGLDALIPTARSTSSPTRPLPAAERTSVPLDEIVPNPDQPRRHFDDAAIDQLANSIREHGLLQPLVVHRTERGYELIAGERRLRAARRVGLETVPVVFRATEEGERLELALIENVQREDLNPLEEAEAYRKLATDHGMTQDDIAKRVGKSRPTIANAMRLLQLPEPVKSLLMSGKLSAGHARAVLSVDGAEAQIRFAHQLVDERLSKSEAEREVKKKRPKKPVGDPALTIDIHLHALADELTRGLGTRVRIHRRPKGGTIEIEFYSDAELDRLAEQLKAASDSRSALL